MVGQELTLYEQDKLLRDRRRTERGFWRKLRHHAGRIPFVGELLAAAIRSILPHINDKHRDAARSAIDRLANPR
jgi:hypothetical protein